MKVVKNIFWGLLGLVLVGGLVYKIFKRAITDQLLRTNAVYTKGVIIDDRNYDPNSPVSHTYSYSYEFTVDGKSYTNNAHDRSKKVGDTVEVEYVKGWPGLNRPVHPTD
jgi:hypothetical protein